MREFMLNGAAGKLEARYTHSEEEGAPAALILHPHPLHGGSMNHKVIYNVYHTLAGEKHKFSVLRFNFRGVGKSKGSFDHGVGELIDAATALDWLQTQNPAASSYFVVGFSFGAWIGMQLLMRRPDLQYFVAISPPAHSCNFDFLSPCPAPGLIVQGTADDVVPESSVIALYEKLDKQKNSNVEYIPIHGAGHFFDGPGQMEKLCDSISEYVSSNANVQQQPRKVRRDRRRRQINLGES
jgi:alpha/beta superfamily hydrolase